MKTYKTLIIGSSFSSVGYAAASEDVLITEQTEMLDTSFYLQQRGFGQYSYVPSTDEGRELLELFRERGIITDRGQNVSAFEIGICRFAEKKDLNIYLKCRVADCRSEKGGFVVTLLHNGGLEEVFAERIIDTRQTNEANRYLAVIFDAPETKIDEARILSVFPKSFVKNAFYEGRYVIYVSVSHSDINDAKAEICGAWQALDGYRILYLAPSFYCSDCVFPRLCDGRYDNPIEAFESGIRAAKEDAI